MSSQFGVNIKKIRSISVHIKVNRIWYNILNRIQSFWERSLLFEGKIKGQIELTRRRVRRLKKQLDDLKGNRGYCQLKEEALDCTMCRNRFGRDFGPVV